MLIYISFYSSISPALLSLDLRHSITFDMPYSTEAILQKITAL